MLIHYIYIYEVLICSYLACVDQWGTRCWHPFFFMPGQVGSNFMEVLSEWVLIIFQYFPEMNEICICIRICLYLQLFILYKCFKCINYYHDYYYIICISAVSRVPLIGPQKSCEDGFFYGRPGFRGSEAEAKATTPWQRQMKYDQSIIISQEIHKHHTITS